MKNIVLFSVVIILALLGGYAGTKIAGKPKLSQESQGQIIAVTQGVDLQLQENGKYLVVEHTAFELDSLNVPVRVEELKKVIDQQRQGIHQAEQIIKNSQLQIERLEAIRAKIPQ